MLFGKRNLERRGRRESRIGEKNHEEGRKKKENHEHYIHHGRNVEQIFFQVCEYILHTSKFQCYGADITCIFDVFLINSYSLGFRGFKGFL